MNALSIKAGAFRRRHANKSFDKNQQDGNNGDRP
jgi:hypothetical protein